jgi:hypothetical protein
MYNQEAQVEYNVYLKGVKAFIQHHINLARVDFECDPSLHKLKINISSIYKTRQKLE